MMIQTITAAMMSVAITQFMTIITHTVANTWSTDDQRRWMRRVLDPGASARVAAGYRFPGVTSRQARRLARSFRVARSGLRSRHRGASIAAREGAASAEPLSAAETHGARRSRGLHRSKL
jgi:hypothetical protein